MPQADLVYNADIAHRPDFLPNTSGGENMSDTMNKCECGKEGWMPIPPVPPIVPPPVPPVPMPWPYPPYPVPVPPPAPDPEPAAGSVAQQICKLSRKANTLDKMIQKLNVNKKDAIITVTGLTYNVGNVDADDEGWTDGSYADTIIRILEYELGKIKTEIATLAEQIGDND